MMDEPEPLNDGSGPSAARSSKKECQQLPVQRCLELFDEPCVVTQSMRAGIEVDVVVDPVGSEQVR
jgi:hypothetical protein